MRVVLLAVALAAAAPAFAQDAAPPGAPEAARPAIARGTMLRDANNLRLAPVNSVKPDGSVGIILASRYVLVPANSLSMIDGKLTTKLTKAQLAR